MAPRAARGMSSGAKSAIRTENRRGGIRPHASKALRLPWGIRFGSPDRPILLVLHQAVAEHLESVLRKLALEGRNLPRYVEEELRRYLPCGMISEGFVRLKCREPDGSRRGPLEPSDVLGAADAGAPGGRAKTLFKPLSPE